MVRMADARAARWFETCAPLFCAWKSKTGFPAKGSPF
jgi:hypothetical protein